MYVQAFTIKQQHIPALLDQGRREVQWTEWLEEIASYLHHPEWAIPNLDAIQFTNVVELFIWTWPESLIQRLAWGPMPHYGALGGVSGFQFEATLDLLDYVVAETVHRTGRTYWTDLAWQRIARLGIVQRKCPDCGQAGAQGQMALYGAIYACDLCQGVQWGSAVY